MPGILNIFKREPDFIIGTKEDPYLLRWYITPWSGWFRTDANGNSIKVEDLPRWKQLVRLLPNIYLHKMLRDDEDRALHDHPWASCSIILKGGYIEWLPLNGTQGVEDWEKTCVTRKPGQIIFRKATQLHRIELHRLWEKIDEPVPHCNHIAWSLFLTGFKVREWGFACPQGWRPWYKFVNPSAAGEIGAGCE